MPATPHPPNPLPRQRPARRRVLCLALLAGALALPAGAQAAFPERPITLVVPTAAGGGNDGMARGVAQKRSALLGRTVIVEKKAGANGAIAAEYGGRGAPDGPTRPFGSIATHGMNPALQKLRDA